jgi:uncharacterized protein YodC (DUF2158 family)
MNRDDKQLMIRHWAQLWSPGLNAEESLFAFLVEAAEVYAQELEETQVLSRAEAVGALIQGLGENLAPGAMPPTAKGPPTPDFKIGDVVRLNSGGSKMTVADCTSEGSARVFYFNGNGSLCRSTVDIPFECLTKVS